MSKFSQKYRVNAKNTVLYNLCIGTIIIMLVKKKNQRQKFANRPIKASSDYPSYESSECLNMKRRIFHSFCHILTTMGQSPPPLLEDQNSTHLQLNIYKSIFVSSSTLGNPCSTTFHMCITQIDLIHLNSNVGLSPSVWEIELTITMASDVMPFFITQEDKALIEAAKMFFFVLVLHRFQAKKSAHTQPTSKSPILHSLVDQKFLPIYLIL